MLIKRMRRALPFEKRVPVILQMTATECGAACLAMILSYFGRNTSLVEMRNMMQAGRDGLTAQAIARNARKLGLRVRAFSIEPSDFKDVILPAIAHWKFDHFVVVEHWTAKFVDIIDPAAGRRRVSTDDFDKAFTGVTLTFEPTVDFHPKAKTSNLTWLRYFLSVLFRTPTLVLQVFLTTVLLQALGLINPVMTQVLIDDVLPSRGFNLLGMMAIGILLLTLAQLLLRFLRSVLLLNLQTRLDAHLMMGFFEHLLRLPFSFFQQRSSGDLLMRLGSNAQIRDALSSSTFSLLLDVVLAISYFMVLVMRHPTLALFVLLFGLSQVALALTTAPKQRDMLRENIAVEAEEQGYLVEVLKGISTLKASGTEDRAMETWSNLFYKALNASVRSSYFHIVLESASWILGTLGPLALFWYGMQRVMNGETTFGEMMGFNALAMAFLAPLGSLLGSYMALQGISARLERIVDVLEATPEAVDGKTPELQGNIELNNISFRYEADGPPILQDVSLHIPAGKKIAIVGRSGSGKSTLAGLLLGLYPPASGHVLYDGIDLRTLELRAVRNQIGVVLQEPFLFNGSIRKNIAFNTPELAADKVEHAAKLAIIHDEIVAMPMGYETRVAEGGSALSGGQRQRMAIARALAAEPRIMVMDEATSHLDVLTERALEANLSGLSCTRMVIAHRMSTVQDADQIIVLDAGRIVEQGTHEQLLALNGHYAALTNSHDFSSQSTTALPAAPASSSPPANAERVRELARLTLGAIERLRKLQGAHNLKQQVQEKN